MATTYRNFSYSGGLDALRRACKEAGLPATFKGDYLLLGGVKVVNFLYNRLGVVSERPEKVTAEDWQKLHTIIGLDIPTEATR